MLYPGSVVPLAMLFFNLYFVLKIHFFATLFNFLNPSKRRDHHKSVSPVTIHIFALNWWWWPWPEMEWAKRLSNIRFDMTNWYQGVREPARSSLHSDASRLKEFHPSLQFVQQNAVPIFFTKACFLGGGRFITDFFLLVFHSVFLKFDMRKSFKSRHVQI